MNITFLDAIKEAMRREMKKDESVYVLGEDVGCFGGCFGATAGLFDEFGDKRVKDTPITVISMAVFILFAIGVVVFLYYQNQQLKNSKTPVRLVLFKQVAR